MAGQVVLGVLSICLRSPDKFLASSPVIVQTFGVFGKTENAVRAEIEA